MLFPQRRREPVLAKLAFMRLARDVNPFVRVILREIDAGCVAYTHGLPNGEAAQQRHYRQRQIPSLSESCRAAHYCHSRLQ